MIQGERVIEKKKCKMFEDLKMKAKNVWVKSMCYNDVMWHIERIDTKQIYISRERIKVNIIKERKDKNFTYSFVSYMDIRW